MNRKLREWGDALIMLQIFAWAGNYRNGTLASHKGSVPFLLAFFSFGIIGILFVILSFQIPDSNAPGDKKRKKR